jgi:hypothetical protein
MPTEAPKNKFQPQGRVKVIQGSIVAPQNAGLRFVLNVTNTVGKAESPMYSLFEKKWPKAKQEAKGWFNTRDGKYKLGAINSTAVQSDTWVIHMLCQNDELTTESGALQTCLREVCKLAKYEQATVHVSTVLTTTIPDLQNLLTTELVDRGISVSFYEEP